MAPPKNDDNALVKVYINVMLLPLSQEDRALIVRFLNMLAAEYEKGEHGETKAFELMRQAAELPW